MHTRKVSIMHENEMQVNIEQRLIAGFLHARTVQGTSFSFKLFGCVELWFNCGPYTKCAVSRDGEDDTWVGSIRNIKQLAEKVIELA
jgi:hypothetical protein